MSLLLLKRLLVVRATSGCRPEAAVQAARHNLFETETPFDVSVLDRYGRVSAMPATAGDGSNYV